MLEYQQALKITIYCSFNFKSYPFDSHKCDFDFGLREQSSTFVIMNSTKIHYKKSTNLPYIEFKLDLRSQTDLKYQNFVKN